MRRKLVLAALALAALTLAALLAVLARGAFGVGRDFAARTADPPGVARQDGERGAGRKVAEALLAVGDERDLRAALVLVDRSRRVGLGTNEVLALHGQAISVLLPTSADQRDPRRALVANLVGALYFEDALLQPSAQTRGLTQAVESFREAVAADPASADAKFNLELVLALLAGGRSSSQGDESQGGITGAGEKPTGTGY